MTLDFLVKNFEYIPSTGELFVLKEGNRHRKVVPNDEQNVVLTIEGSRVKLRYDRLVYRIYHRVDIKSNQVIFHKDLDESNNRISNLCLMDKKVHFKVLEAMKNLNGALRLIPHPTDAFSYILEHRQEGRLRKEVISDISMGKKKLLKAQIKFIKFISKYVLTE